MVVHVVADAATVFLLKVKRWINEYQVIGLSCQSWQNLKAVALKQLSHLGSVKRSHACILTGAPDDLQEPVSGHP